VDDTSIIAVKVGDPRRSEGCGVCMAAETINIAGERSEAR
jgi:hypothetical protein